MGQLFCHIGHYQRYSGNLVYQALKESQKELLEKFLDEIQKYFLVECRNTLFEESRGELLMVF